MQRPLPSVIPPGVKHYPLSVSNFDPANSVVKTSEGVDISYDFLVVAPGLETNVSGVSGLSEALQDPARPVSSIYSAQTVEKVWKNIQALKQGNAIFTQPAGMIKCAGAPQKILWMALSQWTRDGVRGNIDATFATGAPGELISNPSPMHGASLVLVARLLTADIAMFAVPKYSQALESLRQQRNVEGLFQHNLIAVDSKSNVATFKNLADGGKEVQKPFDFLHVVPPQKPWDWVAKSPLGKSITIAI